jgi:isopentenyldiphosphate isomerase
MSEQEELLEVVDHEGKIVNILPRTHIHGNPSLIHRVVHVLIFNEEGKLLLQKRSLNKDVAPGKWDTSVGGHINLGENPVRAAKREMEEELGISLGEPRFLYSYIHSNSYETELVYTYTCLYEGEIFLNPDEIDEVRFWSLVEIHEKLGKGILSDNFEQEISNYMRLMENEIGK